MWNYKTITQWTPNLSWTQIQCWPRRYLLVQSSNRNTWRMCEICSRFWCPIVNFELILHLFLVFLLLPLFAFVCRDLREQSHFIIKFRLCTWLFSKFKAIWNKVTFSKISDCWSKTVLKKDFQTLKKKNSKPYQCIKNYSNSLLWLVFFLKLTEHE